MTRETVLSFDTLSRLAELNLELLGSLVQLNEQYQSFLTDVMQEEDFTRFFEGD